MAEPGLIISHLFEKNGVRARRMTDQAGIWSFRRTNEPDWLSGQPKRRIFHWGLGTVLADFKPAFLRERLDRYLAETKVELFSFDLGPAARRHCGPLPLSRPLGRDSVMRHTEAAVKFVRRFYQGPLAVENYNFYPTGLYGHVTDPDFIGRCLDRFDLGLTLDLAHGAVTAYNLGLAPESYFQALPLEKVRELHISRPWFPASPGLMAVDAHEAPADREWAWLDGLLTGDRLPGDVPVFIEYYRNLSSLESAQAMLAERLRTAAVGRMQV